MRRLRAFVRRDFRLQKSYRFAFVTQMGSLALSLVTTFFLKRIVPGSQRAFDPYGNDYFTFVLIGVAFNSFFGVGLSSFSDAIGSEQAQGTLEALLVTPNDPRMLLAAGALWPFALTAAQLVVLVAIGAAAFGAHIAVAHLAAVVGLLALSLVAFSAVGMLCAAFMVVTKRTGTLVTALSSAFTILGGVLYPVAVLPRPLRLVAEALPMTHGLDAIRRALVAHPDWGAIRYDTLVLAAFSLILVPAALEAFRLSANRARRTGSLAYY